MQITRSYLMQYRTPRLSWTRRQIEALGVDWPPRHGWIDRIVGNSLSADRQRIFETPHPSTPDLLSVEEIIPPTPVPRRPSSLWAESRTDTPHRSCSACQSSLTAPWFHNQDIDSPMRLCDDCYHLNPELQHA